MSEIKFDREIARELQRECSSMMFTYRENHLGGSDTYDCEFCFVFCYAGRGDSIKHAKDCLGQRLLAELDKRLME